MAAKILDGSLLSKKILSDLKESVTTYLKKGKRAPKLTIILVGDNSASQKYVNNKIAAAKDIGIDVDLVKLENNISLNTLENIVKAKNNDDTVDGIIIQLPLPPKISKEKILLTIDKNKDVDGFSPWNVGCIAQDTFYQVVAATPLGIIELLDYYKIRLKGKHVVIVGESIIVGRPIALLALNEGATITIAHKYTKNLAEITMQADVLISAVGKINLIKANMIKANCIVVDVGINLDSNKKIKGDVDFEQVSKKASYITPVPGGVGPMTIAKIMSNLIDLYEKKFF